MPAPEPTNPPPAATTGDERAVANDPRAAGVDLGAKLVRVRPATPQSPWQARVNAWRGRAAPAFVVLFLAGVGGWYLFSHALPRRAETARRAAEAPALQAQLQAAAADADRWEARLREAGDAAPHDAQLLAAAEQIIERHRSLLARTSTADSGALARLRRLESARESLVSRRAAAESAAAELAAQAARAAGDTTLAARKWREALDLRRTANQRATTAAERDLARETRLSGFVEESEAAPLLAQIAAARQRVEAARAAGRADDVLPALREERAARSELAQRFPTSRQADTAAMDRVDEEIATAEAGELVERIAAREREGVTARAAGTPAAAATAYAAAAELQRRLNSGFPKSRFASAARVEDFETRRQIAAASDALQRLAAIDRDVAGRLRRGAAGEVEASLGQAMELIGEIAARTPRALAESDALRRRLTFLWTTRDELAALGAEVQAALVPVPQQGGVRAFATEVPQALYERIMHDNPSRTAGPALPVDGVSWREADEFCRRLSWVLGYDVRLPREAEFAAMFAVRGPAAWTAETAHGRAHPVATATPAGAAALHDVAGNVAEWLQAAAEAPAAPVAGGSFLDDRATVERGGVRHVDKTARARHLGFRFVVEVAP